MVKLSCRPDPRGTHSATICVPVAAVKTVSRNSMLAALAPHMLRQHHEAKLELHEYSYATVCRYRDVMVRTYVDRASARGLPALRDQDAAAYRACERIRFAPEADACDPDAFATWEQAWEAWRLADFLNCQAFQQVANDGLAQHLTPERAVGLLQHPYYTLQDRQLRRACLSMIAANYEVAQQHLEAHQQKVHADVAVARPSFMAGGGGTILTCLLGLLATELEKGGAVSASRAMIEAALNATAVEGRAPLVEEALRPALWRWVVLKADLEVLSAYVSHQSPESVAHYLLSGDAALLRHAALAGRGEQIALLLAAVDDSTAQKALAAVHYEAFREVAPAVPGSLVARQAQWERASAATRSWLRQAGDGQALWHATETSDLPMLRWLLDEVYAPVATESVAEIDRALAGAIAQRQRAAVALLLPLARAGNAAKSLAAAAASNDLPLLLALLPRTNLCSRQAAFVSACSNDAYLTMRAIFLAPTCGGIAGPEAVRNQQETLVLQGEGALASRRASATTDATRARLYALVAEHYRGPLPPPSEALLRGAVAGGHHDWVPILLQRRRSSVVARAATSAALHEAAPDDRALLWLAVDHGDARMVAVLLKHASLSADALRRALVLAAKRNASDVVDQLIPRAGLDGCREAVRACSATDCPESMVSRLLADWLDAYVRAEPPPPPATFATEIDSIQRELLWGGRKNSFLGLFPDGRILQLPNVMAGLYPARLTRLRRDEVADLWRTRLAAGKPEILTHLPPYRAADRVALGSLLWREAWLGGPASVHFLQAIRDRGALPPPLIADPGMWQLPAASQPYAIEGMLLPLPAELWPEMVARAPVEAVEAALKVAAPQPPVCAAELGLALGARTFADRSALIPALLQRLDPAQRPTLFEVVGQDWLEAAAELGADYVVTCVQAVRGLVPEATLTAAQRTEAFFLSAAASFDRYHLRALCDGFRGDEAALGRCLSYADFKSLQRVLVRKDWPLLEMLRQRLPPDFWQRVPPAQIGQALKRYHEPELARWVKCTTSRRAGLTPP